MENIFILMETTMMENIRMIKDMAKEKYINKKLNGIKSSEVGLLLNIIVMRDFLIILFPKQYSIFKQYFLFY